MKSKSLDFIADEGYKVKEDGSVWSRRKLEPLRGTGNKGFVCVLSNKWKQLKPGKSGKYKHMTVSLRKDGKMRSFYVHRLVLEAFVGPCPGGMECRHLDGDTSNNYLTNLCWGTCQENQMDRVRHGTSNRGERCAASKLTTEKVLKIRELWATGKYTQRQIAGMFGMKRQSLISQIVRRVTWRHI